MSLPTEQPGALARALAFFVVPLVVTVLGNLGSDWIKSLATPSPSVAPATQAAVAPPAPPPQPTGVKPAPLPVPLPAPAVQAAPSLLRTAVLMPAARHPEPPVRPLLAPPVSVPVRPPEKLVSVAPERPQPKQPDWDKWLSPSARQAGKPAEAPSQPPIPAVGAIRFHTGRIFHGTLVEVTADSVRLQLRAQPQAVPPRYPLHMVRAIHLADGQCWVWNGGEGRWQRR
jgi:hypothetical protein